MIIKGDKTEIKRFIYNSVFVVTGGIFRRKLTHISISFVDT
ncbi:hypothetical protein VCRA2121O436_50108 [Vibrio crassostreae]|nr:hypothetical protein VCRA2113O420_50141 [Vibrio crassostreae]CAK3542259.1 hypothetical protein VCRA2121O436_50108 [Vibrio crassostreae]